jgi:hypothetical protein
MGGNVKYTLDHNVIRRWAEERNGKPCRFLHIYFPGYGARGSFARVSWDSFFAEFEDKRLAFVYQECSPSGKPSSFYRFLRRPAVNVAPDVGARAESKA